MKKFTFLFLFFYFFQVQAQERLSTTTGVVHFEASVPLFEEVKAINQAVNCSVELKTSEINCTILIKQFQFKRDLMYTHFNDNYLESDRYPKATFIGRIDKFDYKLLSEEPTEHQIKGIIKIHGKSKPLICKAFLKKVTKGMEINSSFVLNTDDFNIEIPSIVATKISKQVNTTLKVVIKE
nr:YceI family protein [uncultured Flavobacterium sp.]